MNQTDQADKPGFLYSAVLVLGVVLLLLSWLLFVFGMIEYIVFDFKQGFNHAVVELRQNAGSPTGSSVQEGVDGMPLNLILYAISSLSFFLLGGFCAVWGTRGLLKLRKQQLEALATTQK